MAEDNWLIRICSFLLSLILWLGSSCQPANSKSGVRIETNMNNHSTQTSGAVTGIWGGDHIALEATDKGAEVQYDCAHGSITEKIVPDRDGKFTVKGTHTREHPGPIRDDEQANSQPALYRGSVNGETMELTVTLGGSNDVIGVFSLSKGKQGRIRRCG